MYHVEGCYTSSVTNERYSPYPGETDAEFRERMTQAALEHERSASVWRARAEERRVVLACVSWTCVALGLILLALMWEGKP